MGWISNVLEWNDKRTKLIQLRHEVAHSEQIFKAKTKGLQPRSEAFEEAYAGYRADIEVDLAEIGQMETRRALDTAYRWGAPVPLHPVLPETENEFWSWNRVLGGFQLTSRGLREIRHAVAAERDIYYRHTLSLMAIGISFLSLFVSIFKT